MDYFAGDSIFLISNKTWIPDLYHRYSDFPTYNLLHELSLVCLKDCFGLFVCLFVCFRWGQYKCCDVLYWFPFYEFFTPILTGVYSFVYFLLLFTKVGETVSSFRSLSILAVFWIFLILFLISVPRAPLQLISPTFQNYFFFLARSK